MSTHYIESPANPRIREVKRLRDSSGNQMLLEGKNLISEALRSGITVEQVFLTEKFLQREKPFVELLRNNTQEFCLVSERAMKAMSDVESPPGLIALASRKAHSINGIPGTFGALLFSLRDPGNFGTILRAAEASGCEFLSFTYDCVNPYSPKVIRASSGSIFRVPLLEVRDLPEYLRNLREHGVSICGLSPRGTSSLFEIQPGSPVLAVIGSESHGLPDSLNPDETWRIPMKGGVESLNVAMASTLCFYKLSSHYQRKSLSEESGGID